MTPFYRKSLRTWSRLKNNARFVFFSYLKKIGDTPPVILILKEPKATKNKLIILPYYRVREKFVCTVLFALKLYFFSCYLFIFSIIINLDV